MIGGYNPTINDQEIIENKEINFIVKGEGEWALHDLVCALRDGRDTQDIPGLITKENGETNPKRKHGDLTELPPLDFSILPKEYLLNENPPRINIELSRGCYHDCSFCIVSRFWDRKIRGHNPDKVITEFEQLKEIGYHGQVTLEEATVSLDSERVKDFLRKLAKFKDDFEFEYIATRYDFIDAEGVGLLDEVGFKNMIFGLESAAPEIQEKLNKHIDLEKFVEACEIVKDFKINLGVFMIVGLPGETRETNAKTHDFLSKLISEGLLNEVFPCNFQPYRGTKAREDLKEAGGTPLAKEKDYFKWLMRDEPLVEYENLKSNDLKEMMKGLLDLNKNAEKTVIEKMM